MADADDIGALDDDEKEMIRSHRARRAEEQAASAKRDAQVEDLKTTFHRLRDMVNGERPTRETNAEYRARKSAASRDLIKGE